MLVDASCNEVRPEETVFGKAAVAMENFVCAAKFLEWMDIIIRSAPQAFIVAVVSVVRGEWHAEL